ncbi:hypothetical protein L9F63_001579, partial [Diploptera punctata]
HMFHFLENKLLFLKYFYLDNSMVKKSAIMIDTLLTLLRVLLGQCFFVIFVFLLVRLEGVLESLQLQLRARTVMR